MGWISLIQTTRPHHAQTRPRILPRCRARKETHKCVHALALARGRTESEFSTIRAILHAWSSVAGALFARKLLLSISGLSAPRNAFQPPVHDGNGVGIDALPFR